MTLPTHEPPAGWYDDPRDPRLIRYWDGVQWSPHGAPKPQGWGQPIAPAHHAAQVSATPRQGKVWWKRWWVIAAALVLFVVIVSPNDDANPSQDSEPPETSSDGSESTQPTPAGDTEAAKPKPPKSTVPRVVGMTRVGAEQKLAEVGLVAFVAREVPSPRPVGMVLRQLRATGAKIREGASVGLVVAAPYPMVPGTAGMTQATATQRLRQAGFQVTVTKEVVTSGRDGLVLRQSPTGAQRAKPHSVVTLVVASVVQPLAPPAPSNCTPGYSPCLAPASDYDCEGGTGDGPRYTGFVRVTGSDPYDLDRDGDGLACES